MLPNGADQPQYPEHGAGVYGHEADYEAMVKALLLRMLVLLNRLLPADAQSGAAPASGSNMEQIEEAMAYIQAHLTEPILLSDLAKAAHMSPCYFPLFSNVSMAFHPGATLPPSASNWRRICLPATG